MLSHYKPTNPPSGAIVHLLTRAHFTALHHSQTLVARSALKEGPKIQALAQVHKMCVPAVAIGASGGTFTANTMASVATTTHSMLLDEVGHYAAMEAPEPVVQPLEGFIEGVDQQYWDRIDSSTTDRRHGR